MAEPDLLKACAGADILLFVVPHQFIGKVCDQLKGHMKKEAVGMSLIKVRAGPALARVPGQVRAAGSSLAWSGCQGNLEILEQKWAVEGRREVGAESLWGFGAVGGEG